MNKNVLVIIRIDAGPVVLIIPDRATHVVVCFNWHFLSTPAVSLTERGHVVYAFFLNFVWQLS